MSIEYQQMPVDNWSDQDEFHFFQFDRKISKNRTQRKHAGQTKYR